MTGAEDIIEETLATEGGYVDDPNDRGGCTNFGITQATLTRWRGREVSCEEVKNLPRDEARRIYWYLYIQEPGFDGIADPGLKELVVDCGVQHGTGRATKWLQRAAGTKADADFGPKTEQAVRESSPGSLYIDILARRNQFYGNLISGDHSQAVFAGGWSARTSKFIRKAAQYLEA